MNALEYALDFRHACKVFDEHKKISEKDLNFILDAGRKAPSAFGLEPWHFISVQSDELKAQLKPVCRNQLQVSSCSNFVIILMRKVHCYTRAHPYFGQWIARESEGNTEKARIIEEKSSQALQNMDTDSWFRSQCNFPASNLMTAAAFLGIDSCPMEGFDAPALELVLSQNVPSVNMQDYHVAICVALGYRVNPQPLQKRWELSEIVTKV